MTSPVSPPVTLSQRRYSSPPNLEEIARIGSRELQLRPDFSSIVSVRPSSIARRIIGDDVLWYKYTAEHMSNPPATAILAFFLRYPNPFARHVLSVDVLSRYVHPETGKLHTQRLILKRGILPKWALSWLPIGGAAGGLDAWVLEESVVDPPGWDGPGSQPKLVSEQGNLNHKKFMHVMEGGTLQAGLKGNTIHHTTAEVKSELGGRWSSLLRTKIESYGVGKFEVNSETARKGMSLILSALRDRQPLPDTAEYYPPPPRGYGDTWAGPEGDAHGGAGMSGRRAASFFLSPGSLAGLRRGREAERGSEQ